MIQTATQTDPRSRRSRVGRVRSIRTRLFFIFFSIGVLFALAIGVPAYINARDALITEAIATMQAQRETRGEQLLLWFDDRRNDIRAASTNETFITALRSFDSAVDNSTQLGRTREGRLAVLRLTYDPSLGGRGGGNEFSPYRATHTRFHGFFEESLSIFGYADILMVAPNGDVVYSVEKNREFATNLYEGRYADTKLAATVRQVLEVRTPGFTMFADFERYAASIEEEPMAFFVSAVFDNEDEEFLGALVYAIDIDDINNILNLRVGLGETGETYIVGDDLLFRSDSRFLDELETDTTILKPEFPVDTMAARSALNDEIDIEFIDDYRGVEVLSAWRPLRLQSETTLKPIPVVWGLIAERDVAEVVAPANELLRNIFVIGGVLLVPLLLIAYVVANQIAKPIEMLTTAAQEIAAGHRDQRVEVRSNDEISVLAQAFNSMAEQVDDLVEGLEGRVNARTRDLELAAAVSRQVATVLDMKDLLPELVESTRVAFDLYHVSVFLFADETRMLDLEAATGKAGQTMLAQGKHFQIDDEIGLVPTAGRERRAVLSNNVTDEPTHFFNPVLPDTNAELALPMVIGDRLIGVLDLQSRKVGRFDDDDLRVLTSLAQQLAVAVQNARLYSQQVAFADEMRTVANMKSRFIASMSHELRTPLNAILNFTQFVAAGILGEVNDKQVDALNKSITSAEHLLDLINDLLDVSKIEAGMMALFVENDVNLNNELETVVALTQSLIDERPVAFITDIDPELPLVVGDRRRLRQVMINLTGNAIKFTTEGQIKLSAQRDGLDHVLLSVSDTGVGIAPEDRDMIFESFRQTESGVRQGSGTGLGLAIAQRLVEDHEGEIWVESEPGVGSTFYVRLPVRSEKLAEMVFE